MNANEAEQELIQEDQLQHPKCQYSVAFSQVCSSRNGEGTVCESTRNLQRFCPGQRPVTISSTKEKFNGSQNDLGGNTDIFPNDRGGFFGFGRGDDNDNDGFGDARGFNPFGFAEGLLNEFAKELQDDLVKRSQQSPSSFPSIPQEKEKESRWGQWFSQKKKDEPKPPMGDIQGPVEEI